MTRKPLSDNEMDALVLRALARLEDRGPSRAFAGKVMNRVQLAPARPLVQYRRATRWLTQPSRALALAGGYAVAASIALFVLFSLVLANGPSVIPGLDWLLAGAGALVRDVGIALAGWAVSSGIVSLAREIPLSGARLWLGAGLLAALYAGCAFGLHVLLRPPRGNDAVKLPA